MITLNSQNYSMNSDSPNPSVNKADPVFIPYRPQRLTASDMVERANSFYEHIKTRRSVRQFSSDPVPKEAIVKAIQAASSAPSGANKQPWTFCLVSDPAIKKEIRVLAEKEEFEGYNGRMNEQWLEDLKPFGTDHVKPYLEDAPYLIVVFKKPFDFNEERKVQNYYVNESVGIATGFLLCALHKAGLATLTHTPSPMAFLTQILKRPENERPFLVIPVGYPHSRAEVPDINKRPINKILVEY